MNRKPNYKKIAVFWVAVFLLGGLAGILGSQLFLPWLAGFSQFNKISWISRIKDGTTIINRTERVVVSEDRAYLDSIGKLMNSLVAVRAEKHYRLVNKKRVLLAKPEVLAEGTGFILTGDGYIVTAAVLTPEAATRYIIIKDNKETEVQLVKKDALSGLAFLKISESNLPVVTLGDPQAIKLGEKVFLLGMQSNASTTSSFVHLGFMRTVNQDLSVDFIESQLANGGPLSNLNGDVIGLSLIDEQGTIKIVGSEKISALLK